MTNITQITKKNKSGISRTEGFVAEGGVIFGPTQRSDVSCLYSNNSIENNKSISENTSESPSSTSDNCLTPYHKRQAQTLFLNVERLVKKEAISINHVGFLTLTFKDNVKDPKEAYRRFRSFNTNFLSKHPVYGEWVNTKEHQKRGAWHFHMIITLDQDIRTGFDFDLYDKWLKGPRKAGTFPTGSKALHQLWAELSEALEKYNFGKIFTLEPIRSNEEALARYVGKYISKHIGQRDEKDKGVRLINYSRNWIKNSANCAWNTDNAKLWRKKLNVFAKKMECSEFYQLTEKLGPGWAYKYQSDIYEITAEEIYLEKTDPKHIKDHESPTLKKIYRNFELAEREINKTKKWSESRKKSEYKAWQKSIAQMEIAKIPSWVCPERSKIIAEEIRVEREDYATRSAFNEKKRCNDYLQAKEVIDSENGCTCTQKLKPNEVPF